jgi:prefoldin subunit 5
LDWVSEAANICYLISAVAAVIGGGYLVARKIEKKLDVLQSETQPNSGSSLRDAVDRIAASVEKIDTRQDVIEKELSNLCGRFDEHTRRNP